MSELTARARDLFLYSQSLRRDLHRHPELGFQETRTAGIVARELVQMGFEVRSGIARTGVVGLLRGLHPGPALLMRFDMDALPIREETGAVYSSETAGIMHACGHDGHVAVGLTTARLLAAQKEKIHGIVKFVFQPAEEGLGGAKQMIDESVLESPVPGAALALHLWNEIPFGSVSIHAGPLMAGGDIFKVVLRGKGGHGALPHQAIDPVATAAHVIVALQTIVSRNLSPLEAAVVSVTQIKAGETFNVIPASAEMAGTIRTFDGTVRERIMAKFDKVIHGVAGGLGCEAEVDVHLLTPPVINDGVVSEKVLQAAQKWMPELKNLPDFKTMVSEDMAFMMQTVPGCYILVGAANPEKGQVFGHHHPKFDFDEAVLPEAAALMTAAALEILK